MCCAASPIRRSSSCCTSTPVSPISNFHYLPVGELAPGQDAIAFRFYVTPSETQPSIQTVYGNEATKLQNLYVYCQFITRLEEP